MPSEAKFRPTPSTDCCHSELSASTRYSRRSAISAGIAFLTTLWTGGAHAGSSREATPPLIKGPFYPEGDDRPEDRDADLAKRKDQKEGAAGDRIDLVGKVLNTDGQSIPNAVVEIWHADSQGLYHHPADPNKGERDSGFQGFGQTRTDSSGRFAFRTIKPGSYPIDAKTIRTPHIHINVIADGHQSLATQLFFAGEPLNEQDIILKQLPAAERGQLILDFRTTEEARPKRGSVDIVLL